MNTPSFEHFLGNPHSRSLKSKLETALNDYRQGLPLYANISFIDPDYESKIQTNIDISKARELNEQLKQFYLLGQFLDLFPQDRDPNNKNHTLALFLFDYFLGEFGAIAHLMDVTPYSITRISSHD